MYLCREYCPSHLTYTWDYCAVQTWIILPLAWHNLLIFHVFVHVHCYLKHRLTISLGLGWCCWKQGSVFGNLNMIRVKFRCILLSKLQFKLEVIKYSSMEKYSRPKMSLWTYSKDWIRFQESDPNPFFFFVTKMERVLNHSSRGGAPHTSRALLSQGPVIARWLWSPERETLWRYFSDSTRSPLKLWRRSAVPSKGA